MALKYEAAQPLFQKTHWSLRAASTVRGAEAVSEWMSWQVALRLGESLIQPPCWKIDGPICHASDRKSRVSRPD